MRGGRAGTEEQGQTDASRRDGVQGLAERVCHGLDRVGDSKSGSGLKQKVAEPWP